MNDEMIVVKGARENNLNDLDVSIPKGKLVVFTGVSGSGKSTLAFDTIFAEGQRRYIQSLSSYARMFLGNFKKPDCDSIDGLQPAISIDQKTTSHNPRSTVGTVTEIYDYMRLLWARIGVAYCPTHNIPIQPFSLQQLAEIVMSKPEGTKVTFFAPVVRNEKGGHAETMQKFIQRGLYKARIDNQPIQKFFVAPVLDKNTKHSIDFQIDRLTISEKERERVYDSLRTALDLGRGYVSIAFNGQDEVLYSTHQSCPICGFTVPPLEATIFSFNNPLGACPDCKGLGVKISADPDLLVPDPSLSINDGALKPYGKNRSSQDWARLEKLCAAEKINMDIPYSRLSPRQKKVIMDGPDQPIRIQLRASTGSLINTVIEDGLRGRIDRLYNQTSSSWMKDYYGSFMGQVICPTCQGARLNSTVLAVRVGGLSIHQACCLSLDKLLDFARNLQLSPSQAEVAELVLKEIEDRLEFLIDVGLDYLTLSRMAMTLSGGESQRIRLATQIGSKLTGVLYVLDEPSIGLHQKDNDKLIATLKEMRDLGNSLIVVEHDEDTMRAADYLVDIGPGAGTHGGRVVATGSVADIEACPASITGAFLAGRERIEMPEIRRMSKRFITIHDATCHNLKNLTVKIPLGEFVCVTGVSGSGKSSLITECLYKRAKQHFGAQHIQPGACGRIDGLKEISQVINVSQDPIGKTPRSNPATYLGIFDDIRELFASMPGAKAKGMNASMFSFNVSGGRCEACQGAGVKRISMDFLPDVFVTCEVCHGKRYSEDVLSIQYRGKSISDILDMRIEDAYDFFKSSPRLERKLKCLIDVGLGYMNLGQPSTEMSGGEAQRIKLANELQRRSDGQALYILDEPTTGLSAYDVRNLIRVLERIVDAGNTVVVIEHNLDLIKCADWIIDLGPDGGDRGGTLVAEGTPEDVAANAASYTGQYLAKILAKEGR